MKKYVLASIMVIILCVCCVCFQLPSRIAFLVERLGYYNSNEYEQIVTDLPMSSFTIDFAKWNNIPEVVYSLNSKVYIQLDSVEKEANRYVLQFTSYAECSFDKGVVIEMIGVPAEKQLSQEVSFWLRGESSTKNAKHYTFEVSPSEFSDLSFDEIQMKSVDLPIYVWLRTYERKQ